MCEDSEETLTHPACIQCQTVLLFMRGDMCEDSTQTLIHPACIQCQTVLLMEICVKTVKRYSHILSAYSVCLYYCSWRYV